MGEDVAERPPAADAPDSPVPCRAAIRAAQRAEAVEPDWEAIRRDYEAERESVTSICRRHGLAVAELTRARLDGGWRPRPPAADANQAGRPRRRDRDGFGSLRRIIAGATSLLRHRIRTEGFDREAATLLNELCRAGRTIGMTDGISVGGSAEASGHGGSRDGGSGSRGRAQRAERPDPAVLRAELKARLEQLRVLRGQVERPGVLQRD